MVVAGSSGGSPRNNGPQWTDEREWIMDTHISPFAPNPENLYGLYSSAEVEAVAGTYTSFERPGAHEELARRADVDTAVELWERLCAVDFVRGETQGYYTHSTAHLSPVGPYGGAGNTHRMPDTAEIEALILSDGEETAYPPHDAQPAYDPSIPDLTAEQRAETYYHEDKNPWSSDDRLYPVTLTLISCGDYHGSDVDAANNRALDGTPGVDVCQPNTGGQGGVFNVSTTVVGEMSSFENGTDEGDTDREPAVRRADALMWLESLVGQMEGLIDYALLDEGVHSEFVDELATEAWANHLESDVRDALLDLAGSHATDGRDYSEVLDDLIQQNPNPVQDAYFGYEENEWTVSSLSAGATNGRHKDAVKHVARTVFGWDL